MDTTSIAAFTSIASLTAVAAVAVILLIHQAALKKLRGQVHNVEDIAHHTTTDVALLKRGALALKAEIDAIRAHLDLVDPAEHERRHHAARIDTEYRNVGLIVTDPDNMTQSQLLDLEAALLTWKSLNVRSETPAEIDADLDKLTDFVSTVDLDNTQRFVLTGHEEAEAAAAAAVYPVPAAPHDPTMPWSSY